MPSSSGSQSSCEGSSSGKRRDKKPILMRRQKFGIRGRLKKGLSLNAEGKSED